MSLSLQINQIYAFQTGGFCMKYINIRGNENPVSVIGIGTMRIAGMNPYEVDTFVHTALDNGINFFDHADIYGGGKSEEVFGDLLAKQPELRDKMFIQSKCGIRNGYFDFSKEHILNSVDGILKRLRTDHIDSLLLHRPDALMEPEEVEEAFSELYKAGKVRYFGVSNHNPFQMELLKSKVTADLWSNQLQMSIVHTPLIDAGLNVDMEDDPAVMRDGGTLEYCRRKDMVVQVWSPLQIGYFGGVFLGHPDYAELNDMLNALADEYQVSADTIAYAWILRYPGKMLVNTGTTRPDRIVSAAKAVDITLTRKQWYDLYKAAGNRLP